MDYFGKLELSNHLPNIWWKVEPNDTKLLFGYQNYEKSEDDFCTGRARSVITLLFSTSADMGHKRNGLMGSNPLVEPLCPQRPNVWPNNSNCPVLGSLLIFLILGCPHKQLLAICLQILTVQKGELKST